MKLVNQVEVSVFSVPLADWGRGLDGGVLGEKHGFLNKSQPDGQGIQSVPGANP